jgi:FkbM family methyltransferase
LAASAAADAAAAAESAAGRALVRTDWGSVLLAANHATAGSRISFELFSSTDAVEPTNFWFAVDEVYGSATYIRDIEPLNVAWWQERVRSAKSARGGACTALDVGSNGGYFTILSRALGCRVLAVDAQPRCLQRLESAAAVNGFEGGVETAWAAVAPEGSGVKSIQVGATKCSGLWAVKDSAWIDAESEHNTEVAARPLVEILREHNFIPTASRPISVMKVDVEGSEVNVLRSALPLLEERLVLAIYAEVVPNRVDAITPWADIRDTFERLYKAGYVCASATPLAHMTLESVLKAFERVQGRPSVSEHWFCVLNE